MLSALDLGCRIEAGDLAPPSRHRPRHASDLLALHHFTVRGFSTSV
jgi:hypothetical protein